MSSRQNYFVNRIVVLVIIAAVLGIGARVLLESQEIRKVTGTGRLKDLLLLISPVASLALVQYSLATRSHGIRDLITEGLAFALPVCFYLLITLPFYFGSVNIESSLDCAWWKVLGCKTETSSPNYLIGIVILLAAGTSIRALINREQHSPARRRNLD